MTSCAVFLLGIALAAAILSNAVLVQGSKMTFIHINDHHSNFDEFGVDLLNTSLPAGLITNVSTVRYYIGKLLKQQQTKKHVKGWKTHPNLQNFYPLFPNKNRWCCPYLVTNQEVESWGWSWKHNCFCCTRWWCVNWYVVLHYLWFRSRCCIHEHNPIRRIHSWKSWIWRWWWRTCWAFYQTSNSGCFFQL